MALLIVHCCENQSLETQRNDKMQTELPQVNDRQTTTLLSVNECK